MQGGGGLQQHVEVGESGLIEGELEEHEILALPDITGIGNLVKFGLAEIVMFTNNFSEENKITVGANSLFRGIMVGRDDVVPEQSRIAVKYYAATRRATQLAREEWQAEIEYLVAFRHHANIINLLGYCQTNKRFFLIYPWLEGGSVHQHLLGFSWQQILQILRGTTAAIMALHSHSPPLIHRDIKSANILLDEEGNAVVCDFGTVGPFERHIRAGTPGYAEARSLLDGVAETGSDIYSMGVLILQLIMKLEHVINPEIQSNDFRDMQIIRWATNQQGSSSKADAVHDSLRGTGGCGPQRAKEITQLGLDCTNEDILSRPTIDVVMERLLQISQEEPRGSMWTLFKGCLACGNPQANQ